MYLRAQYPSLPIAVVSANDDPAVIRRCMEFGATGFLPKTLGVDALRSAIARVLEGEVWTPPRCRAGGASDADSAAVIRRLSTLTPQQVRVLMMLSVGLLNKQIAYELGVSEATVKAHVSAILQKLGVESRTQAVIAARQDRDRDNGRRDADRRDTMASRLLRRDALHAPQRHQSP